MNEYTELGNQITEAARLTMLAISVFIVLAIILFGGSVSILLHYYRENNLLLARTQKLQISLEEKVKEQETVISIISHDLRAPLVNIEGFSGEIAENLKQLEKLLNVDKMPPEQVQPISRILRKSLPEALSFIHTGTAVMNRLIKNLVEVARAGQMPVQSSRIDMNEMAGQIMKDFEFRLKQLNAEVIIEHLPMCMADPVLVRQVFSNLIDNAIKYNEPSRRLRIHLTGTVQEGASVYCIRDNGIGIERENLDKIFSMYHQVGRKQTEGSGVGLAIAKKLVERNGGAIGAQSIPGRGSAFVVRLPHARTIAPMINIKT